MMNVKEYAESVDLSVAEVLKKAQEIGIEVKNATDELSEDDVIILDNAISLISTDTEATLEDNEDIDEVVEEIMGASSIANIKDGEKKQKLKKKSQLNNNNQEEYLSKRKEMYKHKEKLMTNSVDENVILYKSNMTVKDLAEELSVNANEIIMKLMTLGLMVNVNQSIDFDNASLIAMEYNKTLKNEETQDVANFEEYEITDNESDLVVRR